MSPQADFSTIEPFLRELGAYQLEGFQKVWQADIQVKEEASFGKSVVTEYDIESEHRVARFLEEHFPGDSLLGEEHGNVRRDPGRYWVLDPIDGTTNFTQGIAYWGPTLALIENGQTVAGWIYMPAVDELLCAFPGKGAWLNGRRIRSSRIREYSDLATVATTSRLHRRYRLVAPAKQRILGSLVVNLAYLATGTFSAVYCRARLWDVAAGILIAREAGAVVECHPEPDLSRIHELNPESAASFTVYGRANEDLPSLEEFLVPVDTPPATDA
jgi:myo-inositol-1(or 4)-monophosphatase